MKFEKVRKVIKIILGVTIIGGMLSRTYLQYEYMHTLPRDPIPEIGSIYPWEMHGAIVYMTKNQYIVYYCLVALLICGALGVLIMAIITRLFNSDESNS
jgi:hypothetical protein